MEKRLALLAKNKQEQVVTAHNTPFMSVEGDAISSPIISFPILSNDIRYIAICYIDKSVFFCKVYIMHFTAIPKIT
ncbi:MAG TPA: hypothetical protein DD381_00580 [Lentisphaeria bacterium]|nr:MAG: hypothetical protein A2X47_04960 [Lentisphaerae bacterium GWF2_38_69]HBM14838.1 hypothetical protein [Lentisphaeria bacterium]